MAEVIYLIIILFIFNSSFICTHDEISQTVDTTGLLTSQINNSTSFTLSWAPLPCSLHHGVTIGYSIQYSTVPMSSTNSHSRTETVLGSTSIELMGNPFTRYSARIAAIWEDSSRGAYLPPASVFLPAEGSWVTMVIKLNLNLTLVAVNRCWPDVKW